MSFGRRYKLTIGDPNKEGLLIEDLNIQFKILKSDDANDSSSGKATIKIYNLSKKSIERIKKDQAVILQAGYRSDRTEPLVIFSGDILTAFSTKQGNHLETVISCSEGYVPKRQGFTSRSFPKGISVGDMIRDIATSDLKIPVASFDNGDFGDGKGINKAYQNSTSFLGNSSDVLNDLTRNNELTWMIRDGSLYVYPVNGSTKNLIVRSISSETGLIGSPERLQNKPSKLQDSKDLKEGYKVRVLLNGAIRIGDLVSLSSDFVTSNEPFKVSKMIISGQYEGPDWSMELELLSGAK